jgi:hypothetical protein
MTITVDELRSTFASLTECCLHDPQWSPDDVAEVLAVVWEGDESGGWQRGEKQATESQAYTVVRLSDGRYGLLADSEDYTGHGCQCDSATSTFASYDDVLRLGIVEDEARTLIAQIVAERDSA